MESIELAEHASRIGVQAISSLPPLGPYSFEEVRAYYEAIASASGVPVIVYYYPAISPGVRTLEEIERLLEIPGVIGVKFTDFDLFKLSPQATRLPPRFQRARRGARRRVAHGRQRRHRLVLQPDPGTVRRALPAGAPGPMGADAASPAADQ
jgi:hypothetical protein